MLPESSTSSTSSSFDPSVTTDPVGLVDPLDLLLRHRATTWDRQALRRHWQGPGLRWGLAAVIAAAVVVLVVISRRGGEPPEVTLPRAQRTATSASAAANPSAANAVTTPAGSSPAGSATGDLVVHVAGAVRRRGLVHLHAGARVDDALGAAGGPTEDADLDRVNLAQPLSDGVRVMIPRRGEPTDPAAPAGVSGATSAGAGSGTGAGGPTAGEPVDLNTATAAQLDALPGVGPSTAAAIIEYRSAHGPFGSIDELEEVRGIGPAKLETLRSHVTVAG